MPLHPAAVWRTSASAARRCGVRAGVPVPGDPDQVMYVCRRPSNYITALNYCDDRSDLYDEYWKAMVNVSISSGRTSSVPRRLLADILMSAGEPLPA